MKKTILAICLLSFGMATRAQTENETQSVTGMSVAPAEWTAQPQEDTWASDTIFLSEPMFTDYRLSRYRRYAPYSTPYMGWDVHEGLNMSVGASVFAEFGKGARHGAGFAQNITALYVAPLSDKLTLSLGGYFNNMYWQHANYHGAGVTAALGYQFDEHWEAWVFAQKSFTPRRYPLPLYDINQQVGDRIGAAVRYNFSPNFSVQVSVSKVRFDN